MSATLTRSTSQRWPSGHWSASTGGPHTCHVGVGAGVLSGELHSGGEFAGVGRNHAVLLRFARFSLRSNEGGAPHPTVGSAWPGEAGRAAGVELWRRWHSGGVGVAALGRFRAICAAERIATGARSSWDTAGRLGQLCTEPIAGNGGRQNAGTTASHGGQLTAREKAEREGWAHSDGRR
jgi:hypothetical protein